MALRTADIHIRIQPDIKSDAEKILASGGFTLSDGIEQFLSWTVQHNKTPIKLKQRHAKIPNLSTMTKSEVNAMLAEAEKEIAQGKFSAVATSEKRIKEKLQQYAKI